MPAAGPNRKAQPIKTTGDKGAQSGSKAPDANNLP